jgi:predicted lipid-binding transport protein (Tim44 family)
MVLSALSWVVLAMGQDTIYALGSVCAACLLLALVGAVLHRIYLASQSGGDDPMEYRFGEPERRSPRRRKKRSAPVLAKDKAEPRARATAKLLRLMGERDRWFEPAYLKEVAEEAVELVQKSLRSRDYEELEKNLTPECFGTLRKRLKDSEDALARLDEYELTSVKLVHFSASGDPLAHTFTALLTASRETRGGRERYWEEFWTFLRYPKRWKLARTRAADGSDAPGELNDLPPALIAELRRDPETRELLEYVATR